MTSDGARYERSAPHSNDSAAVRFIKNWLSIWKGIFDAVIPKAVLFVAGALGLVALTLYFLMPTFAYGIYLFGIDGVLSEEEMTGSQTTVVFVSELLWVALNATTALAAYRTFGGDTDEQ